MPLDSWETWVDLLDDLLCFKEKQSLDAFTQMPIKKTAALNNSIYSR